MQQEIKQATKDLEEAMLEIIDLQEQQISILKKINKARKKRQLARQLLDNLMLE